MKRVYVKNGVISLAWRDPPYVIVKPPKVLGKRRTIMVYRVDRTERDRKPADDR